MSCHACMSYSFRKNRGKYTCTLYLVIQIKTRAIRYDEFLPPLVLNNSESRFQLIDSQSIKRIVQKFKYYRCSIQL